MRANLSKAFALSVLLTAVASAAEFLSGPLPAAYQTVRPAPARAVPWILSASPRGSAATERALFEPIAHYLTAVTGHQIVYRQPTGALSFAHNLAAGRYDLLFGGPHLAAWAHRHLRARPLVRFSGRLVFDTVVRDPDIHGLPALVGEPVCVSPPPSLATISLLRHFPDVLRQPYLIAVSGWQQAYRELMTGACRATVLPASAVQRFDAQGSALHVIHQSRAYPGYGLVADRHIPRAAQRLIRAALLTPQGRQATALLMRSDAASGWMVAHRRDYAGLSHLLRHALFLGG